MSTEMDPIDPIELYVSKEVLEQYRAAVVALNHAIAGRRNIERHSAVNEELFTALVCAKTAQHWLMTAKQQAAAKHTGAPPPFGLY